MLQSTLIAKTFISSLSEDVSRRKLDLARAAETEQSAKLIPDGRNALTEECRWPQRVIIAPNQTTGRIGEVCLVKKIEDLHTKLERRFLREPRVLKDRKIYLGKTRPAQKVARSIAEDSVAGI
jgi:hypothetical protein